MDEEGEEKQVVCHRVRDSTRGTGMKDRKNSEGDLCVFQCVITLVSQIDSICMCLQLRKTLKIIKYLT